jgi:hypothetical protein
VVPDSIPPGLVIVAIATGARVGTVVVVVVFVVVVVLTKTGVVAEGASVVVVTIGAIVGILVVGDAVGDIVVAIIATEGAFVGLAVARSCAVGKAVPVKNGSGALLFPARLLLLLDESLSLLPPNVIPKTTPRITRTAMMPAPIIILVRLDAAKEESLGIENNVVVVVVVELGIIVSVVVGVVVVGCTMVPERDVCWVGRKLCVENENPFSVCDNTILRRISHINHDIYPKLRTAYY